MAKRKKVGNKVAQPRPRRDSTRLGRLLNRMDVEDCDCKELRCLAGEAGYPERCPGGDPGKRPCDCPVAACGHSLGADHGTSIEDWTWLLEAYDPEGYREPPLPAAVSMVLQPEERQQVLRERARAGVALFHPHDAFKKREDHDDVAVLGGACRRPTALGTDCTLLGRCEREKLRWLVSRVLAFGPRSFHGQEAMWEIEEEELYRQDWPDMATMVEEMFADAVPMTGLACEGCRFCRKAVAHG